MYWSLHVWHCSSCLPALPASTYLADDSHLIHRHWSGLRLSSSMIKLEVSPTKMTFGDRSFAIDWPRVWNSLPASICDPSLSLTDFTNCPFAWAMAVAFVIWIGCLKICELTNEITNHISTNFWLCHCAGSYSVCRFQLMKRWSGCLRAWCPFHSLMSWKPGSWKDRSAYHCCDYCFSRNSL